MSVWHNNGSNVSTLEKKKQDLSRSGRPELWDIENIRSGFQENPKKILVRGQENLMDQNMSYIARLVYFENHTVPHEFIPQQAK